MLPRITAIASQYGWKVELNNDQFELLNRNNKMVAIVSEKVTRSGNRIQIHDTGGTLLFSGKDIEKSVETVIVKYFYAVKTGGK